MKKLIDGIRDFRKNVLPSRREMFARLAMGQAPDALFITCSDSRVAPNWFASTDPGDLFVIRNVGNLVPPCTGSESLEADNSVAAAIEFSILNLQISDIVLCGHSGCGAMQSLAGGSQAGASSHLKRWLRNAEPSLQYPAETIHFDPSLSREDRLSQCNVLQQVKHLQSYPIVCKRLKNNNLRIHAWWFDIAQGNIFTFDDKLRQFVLVDDTVAIPVIECKCEPAELGL